MSKNLLALDAAIRAVCPIDGCCSDGTIWFTEHTTDAQKAAAHKIMQEFPESEANEPSAPPLATLPQPKSIFEA